MRDNWYFSCTCDRCSDATEFESFLSALKCQMCRDKILPNDPLDDDSDWTCRGCQMTLNSSQVDRLVQDLLDEKDKLPRTDLQVEIFNSNIKYP